jgi:hypothetical protein
MSSVFIETVTIRLAIKLILALNEFGLNPHDWQIVASSNDEQILLINAIDPEFRLLGKIHGEKWTSLQVLSI